jgi:hypothetical protein
MVRFTIRDVLWLTTVAGLILALIYTKAFSPTPVASPAPPVGRYQMMSDPKSGYVFLLDSATGKTWKYWGGEWSDGHSPVPVDGR